MTYLFYLFISLCIVVFQTSILSFTPLKDSLYDLMIPLIVYLGLFRRSREGIIVIMFVGIVIDTLSGGPFGIYLTIYLWLFIFVRWMKTFLHAGSAIILPFVFVLSILIQNIAFLGVDALLIPASRIPGNAVGKVSKEILWVICTGPFFILFLNYLHNKWDRLWNKVFLKLLRG